MTNQTSVQMHSKSRQLLVLFALAAVWALLWLPLHIWLVPGLFPDLSPASAFILALGLSFVLISAVQIAFLFFLVRAEKTV